MLPVLPSTSGNTLVPSLGIVASEVVAVIHSWRGTGTGVRGEGRIGLQKSRVLPNRERITMFSADWLF
jgi:hypothetical protein